MAAEVVLAELPLRGPGGEPIDLTRTINSHGVAGLPPLSRENDGTELEVTLPVPGGRPRTLRVRPSDGGALVITRGRRPGATASEELIAGVRHILRWDEDLSHFYRLAAEDPDLAWVVRGAGRMIRSGTVFEEVVKTICTTNCAWSATVRTTTALVEHLGVSDHRALSVDVELC